jgi:uncharacterized protein (DUF1015 family)
MPKIIPFKGLRYNPAIVDNLECVVAPPYDIISDSMQDELYRTHPNNIVRLILNKIEDVDTAKNNRYTRAGEFFNSWLKDNILVQDEGKSFYVYSQTYTYNGKKKEQMGFIGLMELDMAGNKVLPHENTLAAPKTDRLNLMREVRANLSPIFVLYDDKDHKIVSMMKKFCSKTVPVSDVVFENVRNRIWKLDDEALIEEIEKFMADKNIFIADGHHRYEVARMYATEIENKDVPQHLKESSKYLMVYFVESDENMLTVLPAHRLVRDLGELKPGDIKERLERYFTIKKVPGLKVLMSKLDKGGLHCFGMYLGKKEFYLMKLKDPVISDRAIKDKPKAWKRLDVSILHLFIFQHLLGISDGDENVEFVKDPKDIVKLMKEGQYGAAFFLNPTKPGDVKRIASLGERMPRKATYFYPKPLSGLVINKL